MTSRLAMLLALALAGPAPEVPRLESGALPGVPQATVGGGLVLLDVRVDQNGSAGSVRTLLGTPPFTGPLRDAVSGWRFESGDRAAHVLVAALYRPPALLYAGEAVSPAPPPGTPAEIPFPTRAVPPPYPPQAQGDAMVLVEARVGEGGAVSEASIVRSAPGFDEAALEAARQWSFRPASGPAFVYLVFGFRAPVVPPPPAPPR